MHFRKTIAVISYISLIVLSKATFASPILTCVDLQNMNANLNGEYELQNNIDCTNFAFSPIGSPILPFTGTLEGAGYKISNLQLNSEQVSDYVGLFGFSNGAKINNLVLDKVNISGKNNVGALIGMAKNTIITKASSSGVIALQNASAPTIVSANIGGLVGSLGEQSKIDNSNSSVAIKGNFSNSCRSMGGLVGEVIENASIDHSYATGEVFGASDLGGLVGKLHGGTIKNSYATGEVYQNARSEVIYANGGRLGGLVGNMSSLALLKEPSETPRNIIDKCYATGSINSHGKVSSDHDMAGSGFGGLIGMVTSDYGSKTYMCTDNTDSNTSAYINHISNTFAKGYVRGSKNVGGLIGVAGWMMVDYSYEYGFVTSKQPLFNLEEFRPCIFLHKTNYWNMETTGVKTNPTASSFGAALTTQLMNERAGYKNWDFSNTWFMGNSQLKQHKYPCLYGVKCQTY